MFHYNTQKIVSSLFLFTFFKFLIFHSNLFAFTINLFKINHQLHIKWFGFNDVWIIIKKKEIKKRSLITF